LGMEGPLQADVLDTVEAFFTEHGVAPRIDLCPYAHSSLFAAMRERGYVPEQWTGVYAARLAGDRPPQSHLSELEARRLEAREHADWVAAVTAGFAGREPAGRDPIAETAPYVPGMRLYLASWDGVPAGGASLTVDDDVALLGGAATRVGYRRRGVQTALLERRL